MTARSIVWLLAAAWDRCCRIIRQPQTFLLLATRDHVTLTHRFAEQHVMASGTDCAEEGDTLPPIDGAADRRRVNARPVNSNNGPTTGLAPRGTDPAEVVSSDHHRSCGRSNAANYSCEA